MLSALHSLLSILQTLSNLLPGIPEQLKPPNNLLPAQPLVLLLSPGLHRPLLLILSLLYQPQLNMQAKGTPFLLGISLPTLRQSDLNQLFIFQSLYITPPRGLLTDQVQLVAGAWRRVADTSECVATLPTVGDYRLEAGAERLCLIGEGL